MRVTVVALLRLRAVMGKVAEVAPCGTFAPPPSAMTPAGDELSVTMAPPFKAAEVSETVQVEPMAEVSVIGLQERPFNLLTGWIVTVPPATVEGIDTPDGPVILALLT